MIHTSQIISNEEEDPSTRYKDLPDIYDACSFALIVAYLVLLEGAIKDSAWFSTMKDKLAAVHRNHTWELTQLLEGMNAIRLKWVFKSKFNPDGLLLKKKAT